MAFLVVVVRFSSPHALTVFNLFRIKEQTKKSQWHSGGYTHDGGAWLVVDDRMVETIGTVEEYMLHWFKRYNWYVCVCVCVCVCDEISSY